MPSEPNLGIEDWEVYQRRASEILHGGWLMPSVAGPYQRPGGFAYNYVVAGLFALFGESTLPIEILQSALLGVCSVWLYRIFVARLDLLSARIYLVLLAAFLLADQFLYNTRRLLSENLLFLLFPLLLQLVLGANEKRGAWRAPATGIVGGLVMLTRPNLVPMVLATPVLMAVYDWRLHKRIRPAAPAMLVFAVAVFALLPLRDALATGQATIHTLTWTGDWQVPPIATTDLRQPSTVVAAGQAVIGFYLPRIAFVLGLMPILHPGFRVRPHWLLMWGLFAVSTLWRLRETRPLQFWESLLYVWVVLYLGPLVAVAAIDAYGFRMLVPIIPFVLLIACRYLGPLVRREVFIRLSSGGHPSLPFWDVN
jgi:4-amino-4-deoxy-L-arabinose transferase-like glycosyltransferase